MQARELKKGDVVQISPEVPDCFFGGCYMQVTEPKAWGAQGFISIPEKRGGHPVVAYFRCTWENMEFVGRSKWICECPVGEHKHDNT